MPETSAPTLTPRPWLAARSLAQRELVAFFRQRSRVLGAILTPAIIWLMLGMGMGRSFRPEGTEGLGFLEYFFPGIVVFAVVFAGMYSTISTIQDRQAGFLQSVLVAPIPRWSLVVGKMVGGASIAWSEGVLLLLLAPLSGIPLSAMSLLLAALMLALISLAMTGLGFVFAWKIDSVQGYHAIMNLILMPMWMLSGAFFPKGGASGWVQAVMTVNPLHYGLGALRHALYPNGGAAVQGLPPFWLCAVVIVACGALAVVASGSAVNKRPS